MREMVIDRMDTKTRCKFTQCSKLCEKEVKGSKNYVKGIKIGGGYHPELFVGHDEHYFHYCLEFMDVNDLTQKKCIVVYKTVSERYDGWRSELAPCVIKGMKTESGRAEEVRMRYLKEYLEKYQNTITRFEIDDNQFPIATYNMKHLKYLKTVKDETYKDLLEHDFFDLSQIIYADHVCMPDTNFTFNEILKLEGSFYQIKSNEFDEDNIIKYLKMWKNGELHKNMQYLNVSYKTSGEVNGLNIIKGLDVFDYSEDSGFYFFRFCLNYEWKRKCYCDVRYSSLDFCVQIETVCYDKVMKNREWHIY